MNITTATATEAENGLSFEIIDLWLLYKINNGELLECEGVVWNFLNLLSRANIFVEILVYF